MEHQGRGGAGGGGDLCTPGPHKCGVGEGLEQLCGEAHAGVRTAEAAGTGVTPALQLQASLCVTICLLLLACSLVCSRQQMDHCLPPAVVVAAAASELLQSGAAMPADLHCSF